MDFVFWFFFCLFDIDWNLDLFFCLNFQSFRNILSYNISWDPLCQIATQEAADLVSRLLIEDPSARLGKNNIDEVLNIIFFFL